MARIVVADDDYLVRSNICEMLQAVGHEVAEARDGRECEKITAARSPHLVILDIIMPDQEGIQTIRALRKNFPDLKILAISGGGRTAEDSYLETASKLGANAVLKKPFLREALLRTVDALLGKPG